MKVSCSPSETSTTSVESGMVRLTARQVLPVKIRLLSKQEGLCPLCETTLMIKDAVLDHDHATGRVRGVLHRVCNGMEGKVTNAARRAGYSVPVAPEIFIQNIAAWWKTPGYDILYPSFRTTDEKRERVKYRARKRYKRKNHKACQCCQKSPIHASSPIGRAKLSVRVPLILAR